MLVLAKSYLFMSDFTFFYSFQERNSSSKCILVRIKSAQKPENKIFYKVLPLYFGFLKI